MLPGRMMGLIPLTMARRGSRIMLSWEFVEVLGSAIGVAKNPTSYASCIFSWMVLRLLRVPSLVAVADGRGRPTME